MASVATKSGDNNSSEEKYGLFSKCTESWSFTFTYPWFDDKVTTSLRISLKLLKISNMCTVIVAKRRDVNVNIFKPSFEKYLS